MPTETVLAAWNSLQKIVGQNAKVHLTGGEPFLYWDNIIEILKQANACGLGSVDMIETNAFWATNETIAREKVTLLDKLGMAKLKISCDPFHQEYVPIERVQILANTSREILGADRVLVRWQEYLNSNATIAGLTDNQKQKQYLLSMKEHPCRFTGRAAEKCAPLLASTPIEKLKNKTCRGSFLSAKGVHIDPYGNVFSGTCSGITLGNINSTPLEDIWKSFHPENNELIKTLFEQGPYGLMEKAITHGFKKPALLAGKCHLCTIIRQFLDEKEIYF